MTNYLHCRITDYIDQPVPHKASDGRNSLNVGLITTLHSRNQLDSRGNPRNCLQGILTSKFRLGRSFSFPDHLLYINERTNTAAV